MHHELRTEIDFEAMNTALKSRAEDFAGSGS